MTRHLCILLFAVLLLTPLAGRAVSLFPGDLVVTDHTGGTVERVDPVTGVRTVIAAASTDPGSLLVQPWSVAIESTGNLLVSDFGTGSILRIDPTTGAQSVLTSGLGAAAGLSIAANGDVFLADGVLILKIDPITGAQSVVTGFSDQVYDVAIEASGQLIVPLASQEGVVRTDPVTGSNFSLVPGFSLAYEPYGASVAANGDIFVTGFNPGARVERIDPITGATTPISVAGLLGNSLGLDIDANGDLVVANVSNVLRIDPVTGAQAVITSGFVNLFDVAVVPLPEPGTTLLLASGLGGLAVRRRPGRS